MSDKLCRDCPGRQSLLCCKRAPTNGDQAMTSPPNPASEVERAHEIALKHAQRCRDAIADCARFSAAQGEWCRARDIAMDIADEIATLSNKG